LACALIAFSFNIFTSYNGLQYLKRGVGRCQSSPAACKI